MIKITHFYKLGTKGADTMHYDYEYKHGTVGTRYERPSSEKERTWREIINNYFGNGDFVEVEYKGVMHHWKYRNDIAVCAASCHFYTTAASFEDVDTGIKYIVKETHANTYACQM